MDARPKIDIASEGLIPYFKTLIEECGPNKDIIIDFVLSLQDHDNLRPNTRKSYVACITRLSKHHNHKSFMDMKAKDITEFLKSFKKSDTVDPMHKSTGTFNLYVILVKRFFKWLKKPECVEGIKQYRRKETSIYSPSDLWTQEDDLLFLKYCTGKKDRCYHMLAGDLSCRPDEILGLRVKDVVFKMAGNKQYAEVLINGKTGSRHLPLTNSLPYVKDWIDNHPSGNSNSPLICSSDKRIARRILTGAIYAMYSRNKQMFQALSKDQTIPKKDRVAITLLLNKPWNPYIQRHSALTEKSKILKEHVLRQHAGWAPMSHMPEKYVHYFGNESSESLLEAYGIKPKSEEIDKLKPVQCPNCGEACKVDSKFCVKCRMVLSYDTYSESVEEKQESGDALIALSDQIEKLTMEVQQLKKITGH